MFRSILFFISLTLASLLPVSGIRADQPASDKTKTVRLVTVGNSFSQNATRYLNDLVKAKGHTLIHRPLAIGGASFEVHWDKAQLHEKDPKDPRGLYGKKSLREELMSEPWDFVTIQQASIKSHNVETYRPTARQLHDYIKKAAPKSEILMHQTWAYRVDDPRFTKPSKSAGEPSTQKEMYDGLVKAYKTIASELGIRQIPVGAAMYLADTSAKWGYQPDKKFDLKNVTAPALPDQTHSLHTGWRWTAAKDGKKTLSIDGHHASVAGQYLGACVFYEVLFAESVVGNTFSPTEIDRDYARFLQETAHQAVLQQQKQEPKKEGAKSIIGTIERLDPRFDELIPKDAQLEKIGEGFIWTEGAVWYKPAKCLLFSDIPNNVVIKWEPGKGTSEFLKPSGYTGEKPRGGKAGDEPGSNGLFVDAKGRLHLCEHGDRRVTRIEADGKKTVLADNYMGKRLNSPNDLAIHPNGDIYFTDPPYGLAKGDKRELDFTGVYRISGKDGKLSLVSRSLSPNGIALSPDAKKLYVTNAGSWMVFPVNEDGSTGEGKLFVSQKQWKLTPAKGGGVDGLKCDAQGNIFATGPGGVCVIAPDGTLLGRILTGDRTANLCFGGEDGRTLFVCVNHRMGMMRTTTKGIGW